MARIAIINQFYTPDISPTAHLSNSLAEHRAELGDEVTVVASKGGYIPASKDRQQTKLENPRIYRIWTPQLGKGNVLKRCIDYGVFYLLATWRMLRLPAQDVIISLTTPPFIAWTAVLHRVLHRRTKIILWNMDCYPEVAERSDKLKENGFAARLMRAMNRALFRRLNHLVSLDTAMQESLLSQYASPKSNSAASDLAVSVIPNWEKASYFPKQSASAAWTPAKELGLNDKFVVLYLGNMGVGHEFSTLLDAADALRDDPIRFLFVGGGSKWDVVKQTVDEKELSNVILHGYVPKEETPAVMAAADCALITLRDCSLGVMSPSKLHSNLAMGLPVLYIGPEKSNVDDAIQQFGCGASLRHQDVAGIVTFLRHLLNDSERQTALREAARHAFEAAYCDEATLPMFDNVIDGLIQEQTAGSRAQPHNKAVHSQELENEVACKQT